MPDVTFTCPYCEQKLEAATELAGVKIPCPSCQSELQIPAQADSPPVISTPVPVQTALPPARQSSHTPHFIAAKCPSCGGDLQVPDDRDQVKCMYCGGTVIIRQAVQLASGVSVPNLVALAKAAAGAQNHKEAYDYYTKALEYDGRNSEAWFGKGESVGWMSTVAELRIGEMVIPFSYAINYASASDRPRYSQRCSESFTKVCVACYSISRSHLAEFPTVDSAVRLYLANCSTLLSVVNTYPQNKASLELMIRICVDLLEGSYPDWRLAISGQLRHFPFDLTEEYAAHLRTLFDESATQVGLIEPGYVKPRCRTTIKQP
jgi:hypothetical protein